MRRDSMKGMIRTARYFVWTILQAALIFPSVIVGTIVLALVLIGESPARDTLEAFYTYAEEAIKPAPSGFVLQKRCIDPPEVEERMFPSPTCDSQETYLIEAAEAISQSVEVLTRMYLILLCLSAALVLATSPLLRTGLRKPAPGSVDIERYKS